MPLVELDIADVVAHGAEVVVRFQHQERLTTNGAAQVVWLIVEKASLEPYSLLPHFSLVTSLADKGKPLVQVSAL